MESGFPAQRKCFLDRVEEETVAKPIDQFTWKDVPLGCVVTEAGKCP